MPLAPTKPRVRGWGLQDKVGEHNYNFIGLWMFIVITTVTMARVSAIVAMIIQLQTHSN